MGVYWLIKLRTYFQRTAVALATLAILKLLPQQLKAQDWFGDVDLDGKVNIGDVTSLIDHPLANDPFTPFNPYETRPMQASGYGAVGDGVTDDTQALENLFDARHRMHKAAFFEPGTYLIRRALTLRNFGMEIYGDNATIKKREAVTTSLTQAASKIRPTLTLPTPVDSTWASALSISLSLTMPMSNIRHRHFHRGKSGHQFLQCHLLMSKFLSASGNGVSADKYHPIFSAALLEPAF